MSNDEVKDLKDRLSDVEKEFQTFKWKLETGWLKGEAVGASAAATGVSGSASAVSGEFTALSGGLKLWNFEYDMLAEREKRRLKAAKKDPDSLSDRITEVDGRADRRLRAMNRDLNQKLRLKADRSAVGDANTRQNSQIQNLQLTAGRAIEEVRRLYGEIERLDGRF
ncbi:hypothetical protein [Streptomyces sp. NRRL B-1347]|uniref:hypothetical protein n=1 Tax=Streptomyces sp. NRRL B-1347 TaxID=1476877 RepID=UPI0004C70224|nr:hypothetical protein [Streptomyces sp. NRRL B-1347]